jgi:tetratricopeptide (TPR) repeat protein
MSRLGRGLLISALAFGLAARPAAAEPATGAFAIVGQAELATLVARAAEAPYSADAQFEVAMAWARTPFPERAWAALERMSALDPAFAKRVMERYEAAVAADANDLEARFRLAAGLYFHGRTAAARQQLQQIAWRSPQNAWALTYLGWLQAESNRLDLAIGNWQKALAADPSNVVALWLLGQAHFKKGRSAQATETLKQAQSLRLASPMGAK